MRLEPRIIRRSIALAELALAGKIEVECVDAVQSARGDQETVRDESVSCLISVLWALQQPL